MTNKRRRRSWSPEDKHRLAADARERRARGEQWHDIEEALGVTAGLLRAWGRTHAQALLRRVEVVADSEPMRSLALVTPDGFRFEGVDLEAGVKLWRTLR